jgi:two-component system sensor histidine kinase KdpD
MGGADWRHAGMAVSAGTLMKRAPTWDEMGRLAAGILGLALVTVAYAQWLQISNTTIVALTFLLIVLMVAATSRFWVAAVTSSAAMLAFNFFFLPPVGSWTIADPQNWVALFTFLAVSLVASTLSDRAREQAREAVARRDELGRLFDLSREVLLTTDGREAIASLARSIARRFDLAYVAIARPLSSSWDLVEAGPLPIDLDRHQLSLAFAGAQGALEYDARERTYAGHRTMTVGEHTVRLVPLRIGTKPIGLMAASGRPVEPGSLDALAAVVAIAIERASLLDSHKAAEIARRGEELKTALLASLAHDLRTPLTTIRIAASNLQSASLPAEQLREQGGLILAEAERLGRLFENILEMARLDAGAVITDLQWTHPSEVVTAARSQVERVLRDHVLEVSVEPDSPVRIDPRLTASALAHVLENAAQYAPAHSTISVTASVTGEGLVVTVRDRGPGIAPAELPRLFERFYRGSTARSHTSGTGMGLSIARGLLAAEGGRIWAENCAAGGALFSIVVPAETKALA